MTGKDHDGMGNRGTGDPAAGGFGTSDGTSDGTALKGIWSEFDFEAALPLYVGGDLEAADTALVEAWLAGQSEAQVLLDAARASHAVFTDHARRLRSRSTPDLWPSVRAELARAGAFAVDAAPDEARLERSTPDVIGERGVLARMAPGRRGPGGRVLGGAAWFRRRSVAVAAAVLLVTSVGLMVSQGEGSAVHPADDPAGTTAGTTAGPATFTGAPANVRLVGAPARRGVPLRRPAGVAVHMIDDAPAGALWQAGTVPAVVVVPLDQAGLVRDGAELAGGR